MSQADTQDSGLFSSGPGSPDSDSQESLSPVSQVQQTQLADGVAPPQSHRRAAGAVPRVRRAPPEESGTDAPTHVQDLRLPPHVQARVDAELDAWDHDAQPRAWDFEVDPHWRMYSFVRDVFVNSPPHPRAAELADHMAWEWVCAASHESDGPPDTGVDFVLIGRWASSAELLSGAPVIVSMDSPDDVTVCNPTKEASVNVPVTDAGGFIEELDAANRDHWHRLVANAQELLCLPSPDFMGTFQLAMENIGMEIRGTSVPRIPPHRLNGDLDPPERNRVPFHVEPGYAYPNRSRAQIRGVQTTTASRTKRNPAFPPRTHKREVVRRLSAHCAFKGLGALREVYTEARKHISSI